MQQQSSCKSAITQSGGSFFSSSNFEEADKVSQWKRQVTRLPFFK
jgi:hypothetical protein